MSNDKPETSSNTEAAATTDKQMIDAKGVPAPAATPTVPWTSKFLLPSIRFRARKGA
jgi:hypothetical protein